jgi:hypothetical protein
MSNLKYIPFLLLVTISQSIGQEVITHLGAEFTESWDAIEEKQNGQLLFALGFTDATTISGNEYTAEDRDVILGSFSDGNIEIFGQLASAANTHIAFLASNQSGIYLGGNAFSFLVYQDDTLFSETGQNKAFLLKLDHSGKAVGVMTIDANQSALLQDGVLKDQKLTTLLQVNDTVRIDGDLYIPTADQAGLLVAVDSTFHYQNAILIDGGGQISPTQIAQHANNIYIAGQFQGTVISGGDSIMTRTADNDGFLLKLTHAGDHQFMKHLKGVYEDDVAALAVDSNQVYLCGQFIGAIEFDDIQIITGLSVAGFVGAFDHSGQAQWLHPLFGSDNVTSVVDVYRQKNGDILLSAFMGERIIFQGDTIQLEVQPGFVSSVIIQLNENGELLDRTVFKGNPIIFIDQISTYNDAPLLAAAFSGMYQDKTSRGSFDVLLLKMLATFNEVVKIKPLLTYPNPASENILLRKSFHDAQYQIYNLNGLLVMSGRLQNNRIRIAELPLSTYFLRIRDKDGQFWGSKFTIIR